MIESIVGYNGLKSILNYAHLEKSIISTPDNDEVVIPLYDVKMLCCSLLEMFGRKGCCSLELPIGRENVRGGLEKRPSRAKTMQTFKAILAMVSTALDYYTDLCCSPVIPGSQSKNEKYL